MTSRVLEISKTHIVYRFYQFKRAADKETDKFWRDHKVTKLPTTLVFKGGKVVARYEGEVEIEKVLKGVKTKKEQDSWYPDWLKLW